MKLSYRFVVKIVVNFRHRHAFASGAHNSMLVASIKAKSDALLGSRCHGKAVVSASFRCSDVGCC